MTTRIFRTRIIGISTEGVAPNITLLLGEIQEFYANFHVTSDLQELRNRLDSRKARTRRVRPPPPQPEGRDF